MASSKAKKGKQEYVVPSSTAQVRFLRINEEETCCMFMPNPDIHSACLQLHCTSYCTFLGSRPFGALTLDQGPVPATPLEILLNRTSAINVI